MKNIVIELHMEPPTAPPRRRVESRYQLGPDTTAYLLDGERRVYAGRPYNLSRSGVGLLLDRPLAPGTPVTLVLRGLRREDPAELAATVVHSTPHDPGRWLVGCLLSMPLPDDDLHELL